ncbi:MAG TPA: hypothetical protein VJL89_06885 [Thermodesulfovibrionia bacterium]|nr:hypothetical protein [Thermodesulfovibrionia bacterium]
MSVKDILLVVKKELYEHTFKTAKYFLYDPFNQEFFGYRLVDGRYKLLWPDRDDKIYSVMTGLYLIVNDNQLRWMTEEGKIVPTPMELFELEKQRADDAKIKVEIERLRAQEVELKLKHAGELLEIYRRQFGSL